MEEERTRKLSVMDQRWQHGQSEAIQVKLPEAINNVPGAAVSGSDINDLLKERSRAQSVLHTRKPSMLSTVMGVGGKPGPKPTAVMPTHPDHSSETQRAPSGPNHLDPNRIGAMGPKGSASKQNANMRRFSYQIGKEDVGVDAEQMKELTNLYEEVGSKPAVIEEDDEDAND